MNLSIDKDKDTQTSKVIKTKVTKRFNKNHKINCLESRNSGITILRQYITKMYDELDNVSISQDVQGMKAALVNSSLGTTEHFLVCIYDMHRLTKVATSHLTQFAEKIEELALAINQGKNIIRIAAQHDPKIANLYEQYYG